MGVGSGCLVVPLWTTDWLTLLTSSSKFRIALCEVLPQKQYSKENAVRTTDRTIKQGVRIAITTTIGLFSYLRPLKVSKSYHNCTEERRDRCTYYIIRYSVIIHNAHNSDIPSLHHSVTRHCYALWDASDWMRVCKYIYILVTPSIWLHALSLWLKVIEIQWTSTSSCRHLGV